MKKQAYFFLTIKNIIVLISCLFLLTSCLTQQEIMVYWKDDHGNAIDSQLIEKISSKDLVDEIKTQFIQAENDGELFYIAFLNTKIFMQSFKDSPNYQFIKELSVLSALFAIAYYEFPSNLNNEYLKEYISLGYIKEILSITSEKSDKEISYHSALFKILSEGYWHKEAIISLINIIHEIIELGSNNNLVNFSFDSNSIQSKIQDALRHYKKWYEDMNVLVLFSEMGYFYD